MVNYDRCIECPANEAVSAQNQEAFPNSDM